MSPAPFIIHKLYLLSPLLDPKLHSRQLHLFPMFPFNLVKYGLTITFVSWMFNIVPALCSRKWQATENSLPDCITQPPLKNSPRMFAFDFPKAEQRLLGILNAQLEGISMPSNIPSKLKFCQPNCLNIPFLWFSLLAISKSEEMRVAADETLYHWTWAFLASFVLNLLLSQWPPWPWCYFCKRQWCLLHDDADDFCNPGHWVSTFLEIMTHRSLLP